MTTVLCTLYNSLYLDKGLVLYDSLCECAKDFKLYVLCMDDKCYEVLNDLNQVHHIPVRLSDFEKGDEALLVAKANRPMGEYCWTCSSSFIRYVLEHYNEDSCTYIDADMYFYSDPQVLIDEMLEAGKSVMVVPHRFPERQKDVARRVGTYCVEFNTFLNIPEALEVLEYWRSRCLDCCSNLGDGIHWGDQKYLEELVRIFNCVYVCTNHGAGMAPFNVMHYKISNIADDKIIKKDANIPVSLVFYHFQTIQYLSRQVINTGVFTTKDIDINLVDLLYIPYLKRIEEKKKLLESKFYISQLIKHHPAIKKQKCVDIVKKLSPAHIYESVKNQLLKVRPYIIYIDNGEN